MAAPLPAVGLDALNQRLASDVRSLMAGVAVDGFVARDEQWVRPAQVDLGDFASDVPMVQESLFLRAPARVPRRGG